MGITKNVQNWEAIADMAKRAFPEKELKNVIELTEGMCNAAYLVEFSDGSRSVLKIAASGNEGLMSQEVNMMDAEVEAMRLVREHDAMRVADVQYYDTSRTLCSGKYFFMEALEGQSLSSLRESLSEEEKSRLYFEAGQMSANLTKIQGEKFGLLGDKEHTYDSLFAFMYRLVSDVLQDARRKDVKITVPDEEILERLKKDSELFEEVKVPTLVHWDMWEGNIFVKDGHVSGVIDWERAMWGESFMDDRFRRHTRNSDFLKGFGKESFTKEEQRRISWYDLYLYLVMMTEGSYREYEDDSQYRWVKPLFEAAWEELVQPAAL